MPRRAISLSLSIVALVVACGGPPRSGSTTLASGGSEAAPSAGWLVWSDEGEGQARTTWLDAAGHERATREGVVIAHDGALLEYVVTEARPRLMTCEQLEAEDGEPPAGEEAVLRQADLVEIGGPRRISLVGPAERESSAEVQQTVTLRASLGPYVFVESAVESFACGAHGNREVESLVVDVSSGEPAQLELDDEGLEPVRARALEALLAEGEGALDVIPELDMIQLVESVPTLEQGRVVMEHVLVTEACYACSDGRWSSYTRAATVRDERLPAALAPYASLPPPVAQWLAARPGARGVSTVSAEHAERLNRLFSTVSEAPSRGAQPAS